MTKQETHSDKISWHNARLLTVAQAISGANPAIIITTGGLVGHALASDPSLATVPVSTYQLGVALGTIPAAMVMSRFGRRNSYLLSALIAILSGLVCALAIYLSSFLLFCFGTLMAGSYASYVQSFRFAATDGASAELRPRLISWVMVGGLFAAFIGPQVVLSTADMMSEYPNLATYLGLALLGACVIPILYFLRTPNADTGVAQGVGAPKEVRSLMEIASSPQFIIAVMAGVVSYSLMSFIMTAAPLAMMHHGHDKADAALGIRWHILAMYAPSFFTGAFIMRFGSRTITALGLLILAASGMIAQMGMEISHFWISLILLGLGWNFGFIGATAMVTDCYRPEEKTKVQTMNDFLVFASVAISSFSSGKVLADSGWYAVNALIYPAVAIVLALLLVYSRIGRKTSHS